MRLMLHTFTKDTRRLWPAIAVSWLMLGSVPAAFSGVLVLRALGDDAGSRLKLWLGIALLVAAGCIVLKARLQQLRRAEERVLVSAGNLPEAPGPPPLIVRPLPTLAIGAVAVFMIVVAVRVILSLPFTYCQPVKPLRLSIVVPVRKVLRGEFVIKLKMALEALRGSFPDSDIAMHQRFGLCEFLPLSA